MKFTVCLAIAASVLAGTALAGTKSSFPVTIDDTTRLASGSLGSARNSADNTQYIQCFTATLPGKTGYCEARNSLGTTRGCTTNNADFFLNIVGLNDESFVRFGWDTNGTCTFLLIQKSSVYAPKL
jgi:hypothetical protein